MDIPARLVEIMRWLARESVWRPPVLLCGGSSIDPGGHTGKDAIGDRDRRDSGDVMTFGSGQTQLTP